MNKTDKMLKLCESTTSKNRQMNEASNSKTNKKVVDAYLELSEIEELVDEFMDTQDGESIFWVDYGDSDFDIVAAASWGAKHPKFTVYQPDPDTAVLFDEPAFMKYYKKVMK